MLEDTLLKIRFNRGDKDALCRIYQKYKDDLLKLAVALLNDISLAEDVLNDTFVSFTQSVGKLRLTGNLKSFLTTCVANHARNVYCQRERKKMVGLDEAVQIKANTSEPEQSVIFAEEYRRLQSAMDELAYEQRETVILHCYNGLRFRQIASLQNISVNTVKSRYRYGLNKLRSILNSELENEKN
ncbi:MAG: RNA polymerase sigma factor [Planctomycetota bacterium]|jgi:RNA polymerase sigma-70 factor (ECF subfamily)